MIGGVGLSQASGNETEYLHTISNNLTDGMVAYNNCTPEAAMIRGTPENPENCAFGTGNDQQMMAKISYTGYLIFAGCFAATLSSGKKKKILKIDISKHLSF